MELNQALVKMEQGGSTDGILQVRADRIQSDLEGLLKALAERCKKHGIDVKSTAVIELPQGWQPGVPEISAVWDEDWDKFEDEGALTTKDGVLLTTMMMLILYGDSIMTPLRMPIMRSMERVISLTPIVSPQVSTAHNRIQRRFRRISAIS